ncbi:hypothetical protein M1437_02765 [Patescibacteria group bacterium]|nr:hypothetical protein [Patescibacteria group bacterium]
MALDKERFLKVRIVTNPMYRREEVSLNPDDYECRETRDLLTQAGCTVVRREFTRRERLVKELTLPNLYSVASRLREVFGKAVTTAGNVVKYPHNARAS